MLYYAHIESEVDILNIKEALYYARIKRIEFKDFRNIESGAVDFPNAKATDYYAGASSILGLYGQNGSGKSSVIMALGILKDVLSGKKIGDNYASCVRVGCEKCSLSFTFSMFSNLFDDENNVINDGMSACIEVFYDFDIQKKTIATTDDLGMPEEKTIFCIENEVLKLRFADSSGKTLMPKQTFFDTRKAVSDDKGRAFGSEQKYELFTCFGDKEYSNQYKTAKAIAKENGTSFLFSRKFYECLEQVIAEFFEDDSIASASTNFYDALQEEQDLKSVVGKQNSEELGLIAFLTIPFNIIKNLGTFGRMYLQVVDTATTGMTNINSTLPLLLWKHNQGSGAFFYKISLLMDKPTAVPEKWYTRTMQALKSVSDVLSKIVPDMSLDFSDLGKRLTKDNEEEHCFEIMSRRNNRTIPLKYESDGIRRMVSILSLLIAVYNEESFTVAIDEIDSGIFEYLLGEVLSVMSDSIKGQFIFTSHNLRALEVLPAKYLCFTTVDPGNRFTTLPHRGNSNMRDTYFRNIVLGSDKESIYNPTDRFEIENAFYRAGHSEANES